MRTIKWPNQLRSCPFYSFFLSRGPPRDKNALEAVSFPDCSRATLVSVGTLNDGIQRRGR